MPVAISDFLVPLMCYRPRTLCHSAGKETAGCQDKDFNGPQSLGSQIVIRKIISLHILIVSPLVDMPRVALHGSTQEKYLLYLNLSLLLK